MNIIYKFKIEDEIKEAPKRKQDTMNRCLCESDIRFSECIKECIDVGEQLGRLDNRIVHKWCTSTYEPEWIMAAINKKIRNNINRKEDRRSIWS